MSLGILVKEVQRKIGRNIILFQKLESLLKYLVANGQYCLSLIEFENHLSERQSIVNKQTMGVLVGQFVERNNPARDEYSFGPNELEVPSVLMDFRIEMDKDQYQERKELFAKLVSERNELVHHLLPKLDSSIENAKKLEKDLDKQAEQLRTQIKDIQFEIDCLKDNQKIICDEIVADKDKELLLSLLRDEPLVLLLADIAIKMAREDGWALMGKAGQLVKQYAPDELALLHEGSDYKSLKSLMLKTEIFEFKEEQTDNGGLRALFRLKDGWRLSDGYPH